MDNEEMRLADYRKRLSDEFDRIQKSFDDDKPEIKKQTTKPMTKKLTAQKAQAIKDEVRAEETHNWTTNK